MNILDRLGINSTFNSSVKKCKKEITPILNRYLTNFPDFTDHSINHSESVLLFADYLLDGIIKELNIDEIYILTMACYLHDIGMSPTPKMSYKIKQSEEFNEYKKEGKGNYKSYIRQIHHRLTYNYIMSFWESFNIPNERYAIAIAIVAKGHRQENLLDEELFNPKFFVRSGRDYVCLPFLAGVLRLSDELQITNDRITDLLFNEYLPKNKISREEWEKHKSNYCVNFTENKIVITSKCNKKIYESMHRHYEKIENTLLEVNKVFKNLILKDRLLKIKYEKVIPEIETEGFIAKNIRFNLDLQNTLNTIIGERLYSDKNIAIREALQNSIDSCRYKKKINPSFHPSIKIYLDRNNQMVIEDNGLGMDEYIIENFFAKLGSSFYTQTNIKKEFDSISEFGIGIFSYFLLCDYFEVETKMTHKSAIKFRVTKDADTQFFFYDHSNRLNTGTKVTFFLMKPLSFEKLETIVRYHIRFLEFPIHIRSGNMKKVINKQKFEINKYPKLKTLISEAESEELKNMCILARKLDTDDYSGICGLILGKDESDNLVPVTFARNLFKEDTIKISIAQKGIFLQDISFQLILYNMLGKINLKKKNELNLSRTGLIAGDYLLKLLTDFSIELIEALFKSWRKLSNKKKAFLTKDFINYYLMSANLTYDIINAILKYFILETFNGSKVNYISFKKFLNDNPKIILLRCEDNYRGNNFKEIKKIYKDLSIPILLFYTRGNSRFYLDILNKLNKKITVHSTKLRSYYVIYTKQKATQKEFPLVYSNFELLKMNNDWIATSCNMGSEFPFNSSHNIVKYFLINCKLIFKNNELTDLWRKFFIEIHDLINSMHTVSIIDWEVDNSILQMKKILKIINNKMNAELKISKQDFPSFTYFS